MASIRFWLNKKKNGTCHIMASFQNGAGTPPTKYTGCSIPATKSGKSDYKHWNKKKQRVRSLEPDEEDQINAKLDAWEGSYKKYLADCSASSQPADIPMFIGSLDGAVKSFQQVATRDKVNTFLSVATRFVDSIALTHKGATKSTFNVVIGDIKKFEETTGRTIYISQINGTFYKEFAAFLINTQGNINSTVEKKQKKISRILTFAKEDLKIKLHDESKKKVKLKKAKAPKFPLRPEELQAIRVYACDTKYKQKVLDAFILACETGLRYSDIVQLRRAHLQSRVTSDGIINIIDLTMIKGSKENSVPVSIYAMDIIDKYGNVDGPMFTFNKKNPASRVLKEIFAEENLNLDRPCEVVRIKGAETTREIYPLHDVISFHTGRNTFITRLWQAGLSSAYIRDNAGHSDVATTQTYYRDSDTARFQETLRILNG